MGNGENFGVNRLNREKMKFSGLVARKLKNGGIGVLPTDTIYGLVGSALFKKTVERIYCLRGRNSKKPMIIIIGSVNDLNLFGVKTDSVEKKILNKLWPGKISVILPCLHKKFRYLHRGIKTLAFRLPENTGLTELLKKTGPLVAPSANLEGFPPAKTISMAKKYFKDKADFYVDAGRMESLPSTVVSVKNNSVIVVREGAVKIKI